MYFYFILVAAHNFSLLVYPPMMRNIMTFEIQKHAQQILQVKALNWMG